MAKRKTRKTAAQAAAKWLAGMQSGSAQQNYATNTANKGTLAMNQAANESALNLYAQNCQQSVTNGTRAAALLDPMSIQLYNQNTGQKGAAQLGVGAQKKQPKYQAAIQKLQTVYDQMKAAADAVDPTRSRATASARAQAALAVLMAAGKKGGG